MFKNCCKPAVNAVSEKFEDLMAFTKLNDLLNRKSKKKKTVCIVLAVIAGIALVAGIAYLVYRYMNPDYLEDFEDLDDDFEDIDDEAEDLDNFEEK